MTSAALCGAFITLSCICTAYGQVSGDRDQVWSQSGDILGVTETNDRFGSAIVAGDFNGDGVDDLAIGSPGEDVGAIENAGAVNVICGTQGSGLAATGNQLFTQDTADTLDSAEEGDQYGFSLASGDFNNDSYDDLAIGVPGEDRGLGGIPPGYFAENTGSVVVLYGS